MTTCMVDYSPVKFASLPTICAAYERAEAESVALWTLGELLCDFGIDGQLGIALLHKHFELRPDERLVRRYAEQRCDIAPRRRIGTVAPCIWAVSEGAAVQLVPLEFTDAGAMPSAFEANDGIEASPAFVTAFVETARALGVADLFGLGALHGVWHILPGLNETIVEIGAGPRALQLIKTERSELEGVETAQTLWRFSRAAPDASTDCPIASPDGRFSAHCYHCTHCTNPILHR